MDYSKLRCSTVQDVPPYPPQLLAPSPAAPPNSNDTADGRRPWLLTLERPVGSVADVTVLGQPLGEFFSRVNAMPDAELTSEVSVGPSTRRSVHAFSPPCICLWTVFFVAVLW